MVGDGATTSSSTSLSLLRKVRENQPDAWIRLTRIYGPLVYRWCRRADIAPDDAPDLVQEVFRAVTAGIDSFRRERAGDSFRGWLYGITRNKINDHFRRITGKPAAAGGTAMNEQMAQVPSPDEDSATSASNPNDQTLVVRETLRQIRDEFEEKNWQAFWRTAVNHETSTAVASDLGMTSGAVRQAKFRILRRLRQELEELDDLDNLLR